MIRAFVGLPLPESYQEQLVAARKLAQPLLRSKLSWTKPGNWHLTLKFLGDCEKGAVAEIKGALATIACEPFTLHAGVAGTFPPVDTPRKPPRVLWLGLREGADEARALAGRVETALEPLGFAPEPRPFRAHLTLARIKKPARDPWPEVLRTLGELDWPEVEIDRFVLWQSKLTPQGPQYSELGVFRTE